jgi:hypothetical protein
MVIAEKDTGISHQQVLEGVVQPVSRIRKLKLRDMVSTETQGKRI